MGFAAPAGNPGELNPTPSYIRERKPVDRACVSGSRIAQDHHQRDPMAKEKFNRNKPHCNIGTIGHVDMARRP